VVFSGISRAKNDRPTLWLSRGAFSIGEQPPEDATGLFSGVLAADAAASTAAIGITDDDGMLLYIETDTPESGVALGKLLTDLGCSSKMFVAHSLAPALGGTTGLDGAPAPLTETASVRLVRHAAPGAKSIFEDTPVVPPEVWQPLQMRRIRYFKKPTPTSATSASATPSLPTSSSSASPANPHGRSTEKGLSE
jgi:hypothetical protein